MDVRLIAVTKGVAEATTGEELISYVARVSNPSNQSNFETAPKLIGYLIKHRHWSPLEHSFMTVEITTSRAIAQQLIRHRSFTWQEFSQRYAQALECEKYDARRQDVKNRQNSLDDMSEDDRKWFEQAQTENWDRANNLYQEALARSIAKEQARFLLPLATQTKLYMSGSTRSFLHYIELRADKATQLEHREIAQKIKEIFCDEFPNVAAALEWR